MSRAQELLGMIEAHTPVLKSSNQADDHYAIFVGSKRLVTTKAGWDGPDSLCTWSDGPDSITLKKAYSLGRKYGIPKAFIDYYDKNKGQFSRFDKHSLEKASGGKVEIKI